MSNVSRKNKLKAIVDKINKILEDDNMVSIPRSEYESPQERSGYNYGYMTDAEIGSGNQEAL